ncbi:conserved exported hypothetical protein [Verrucomicrobia bacterium]|nr:conserved exported hypothetical protein [Verrucomicrobiota bacterium]
MPDMLAYALMKMKFVFALAALVLVVVSCVNTVSGHKAGGVPLIRDTMEGRYERPPDQVFAAAKEVVARLGVLSNESTLYDQTNQVKTVEGKVNQRRVWVRIEAVDPKVTAVTVQTRTRGGGSDLDLAHEIEKEIGIDLAARR